ncbi:MAG: LamG domain-containing protein, partial [Anaerolineae bacterium]|nr:LamG domain-containing protein [Anaerolineae bacterium]
RHTAGSYYLFSVRDDGYFQFSLWNGVAWDPIVDWTQTTSVQAGMANRIAVKADGARFELYINGALVHEAEDDQIVGGEAGLSISTAATDGLAVFAFDNFELWGP